MAHRVWMKITALLAALFVLCGVAVGCQRTDPLPTTTTTTTTAVAITSLTIEADERVYMPQGGTVQLKTNHPDEVARYFTWESSNDVVTVQNGLVTALGYGKSVVTVSYGGFTARVMIEVVAQEEQDGGSSDTGSTTNSQPIVTRPTQTPPTRYPDDYIPDDDDSDDELPTLFDYDQFYRDSVPAASYSEALQRSLRGELSGSSVVPDEAPTLSVYRPMQGGQYVHNIRSYYADDNTYVVVDAYGYEAFRIYRGGAYITLEEVAAYVYAFGDVPANYVSSKKTKPSDSKWGEYLRLNHTKFSGSTKKYPYEPQLPRINGCGGDLQYYEIDIGTTGTTAGSDQYGIRIYNNGSSIERGAARIVYARYDANGDLVIDEDEKYVFYTYNHYNDFQEYLNYYGGWGEMFGNITGGGTLSSKYDYAPTPYVPTVRSELLPPVGSGPAWDEAA